MFNTHTHMHEFLSVCVWSNISRGEVCCVIFLLWALKGLIQKPRCFYNIPPSILHLYISYITLGTCLMTPRLYQTVFIAFTTIFLKEMEVWWWQKKSCSRLLQILIVLHSKHEKMLFFEKCVCVNFFFWQTITAANSNRIK